MGGISEHSPSLPSVCSPCPGLAPSHLSPGLPLPWVPGIPDLAKTVPESQSTCLDPHAGDLEAAKLREIEIKACGKVEEDM